MAETFDPQKDFNAYYYATGCGSPYERNDKWLEFFQGIADRIIADFQPETVLDAGCAKGFLVEGFRNRGVDAWGVDISEYAIQEVFETVKPYCWVGSIVDLFPQKYDLIVSIEVLEHMPAEMGRKAIANLCAHTERIVFSSTPFDYKETTHYNVQPPEYWAREFARNGFFRDMDTDVSFITAWAVCFRKNNQPVHQLAYDYERRYWLLGKENTDLRQLSNELRNKTSEAQQIINNLQQQLSTLSDQMQVKNLEDQVNQLQNKLFQSEKEKEVISNEAIAYKERWERFQQTRTWKWLTTIHKFRKMIFKK